MSEILTYLTTNEDQFRRARLAALYADFRHLRTINPDGYNANIEAWRKGLADAVKKGHVPARGSTKDLLLLTVDEELLGALETKEWGRPLALGTVMRDAITKKDMFPLHEFLTNKESIYNASWSFSPWQIISWGIRQLGLAGGQYGEDKLPVGKLVILSNIEEAAKGVLAEARMQTTWVERIYSKRDFYKKFKFALGIGQPMSESDMNVLLRYLSRDKGAIAYDGDTVKFKGSHDRTSPTITSEDITVASLRSLIADLEGQVQTLSSRINNLAETARNAVSKNNKVSALAALRSKKLAEANFSRQSAVLNQLEEVYIKIGEAANQVEVVRIMEGSTGVLKTLNKEIGGVDRVDLVVDRLKEQMTQVDEVNTVISELGQTASVISESEVDDELEAMEQEEREKRNAEERLADEQREREKVTETYHRLNQLPSVEGIEVKSQNNMGNEPISSTANQSESLEKRTQELQQLSL